jgi:hypothetical protein
MTSGKDAAGNDRLTMMVLLEVQAAKIAEQEPSYQICQDRNCKAGIFHKILISREALGLFAFLVCCASDLRTNCK